ncbi:MAG: type IV pili methyl-accepting chemotaxis transducer N-terminal domain-containing protein [Thiotrichaceae bacterium]|nr:type IV pili methyl-accepting chemotaxis transducer N-terminal domain-containing protein [Thiotrichaceae bacterium]
MGRAILSFGIFLILLTSILTITVIVTKHQKDDSLIVNLSGRQRMLTQKMTKEALIFSNIALSSEQEPNALRKWKNKLLKTMEVFETTLFALKDGGSAPLNLDMTRFRQTPPTTKPEIKAGLKYVVELWLPLKENINEVIQSLGQDSKALDYVIANNVHLLKAMNKVVFQMQKEAERKVLFMFNAQVIAVVLGAMLVILIILAVKLTIVNPINNLVNAANAMSLGNLNQAIAPSGLREIRELSNSLDRMRISLQRMMERWSKKH